MNLKHCLVIMAGLAASLAASAQEVRRDIEYATVGDIRLAFDYYPPTVATSAPPPLIVWIHGGGWRAGSRDSVSILEMREAGMAIASVSYRLSPQAAFPAQIHDLKGAVRHLRAHAAELGFDPDRIVASGASAGAHLAALLAATNGSAAHEGNVGGNLQTSSDVQALVSYFGASNLTSILRQSTPFGLGIREPALDLLLGGQPDTMEPLARLASPVFYIDPSDPPMYLLHGDQDPQMPINQTHELHGAAKAAGLETEFDVVHGAVHGGEGFWLSERTANVVAWLRRVL